MATALRSSKPTLKYDSIPEVNKCHFLIARADKHHFINHFYYRLYQTYGTEKKQYDDLFD